MFWPSDVEILSKFKENVDFSSFLSNRLKVDPNEILGQEPSVAVLTKILNGFYYNVPFSNLDVISTPRSERNVPTIDEIIKAVVEGRGGLCFTMNLFLKYFLECLGFQVNLFKAYLFLTKQSIHLCPMVMNLSFEGSMHIVDVGAAYPGFSPILLQEAVCPHKDGSYPVYSVSYTAARFVQESNSIYRQHKRIADHEFFNYSPEEKAVDENFFTFIVIKLEPILSIPEELFPDMLSFVYCAPSEKTSRVIKGIRLTMLANDGLIAFKNNVLMKQVGDGSIVKQEFSTPEGLKNAIGEHFQAFDARTISDAVDDVKDFIF